MQCWLGPNANQETMGDPTKGNSAVFNLNNDLQEGLSGAVSTADLKQKSVRGGAASLIGQGYGMALQIGTTIVLARILSPTDYGIQAMVLTLINLFSLLKDAGLSAATVQRQTLTHEQISTLFWINLALGTVLTMGVAAMGPLLVAFYKDPRLLWVTIASATVFLFNSLGVQHTALLNRAMRFTTRVRIDILTCTIGAVIAVVMAVLGCGYWSLICQNISIPIVGAVAVWIAMPWMPGRPRWTRELHSLVRFGGTVTLNSLVMYVAYNGEKILLGRFWGPAALGLYGRAYQLANLPVQQATDSVGGVAIPMLCRLQADPGLLRRSYLKTHSLIVSLTVPAVIACALFADEIVRIVLGPKWSGAAAVLRLLSPTVLVFALMNPLSWFLRATGRVERSLKIALFIAPVMIIGVLAGISHGPVGVALGYSTAIVLLFGPLVAWAKHGTGITTRDYWECIKRPLIAGGLSGAAAGLFKLAFHHTMAPTPAFLLALTIFLAVYAGLLLFVMDQKKIYVDLISNLFQRKPGLAETS
jgi:O-antigen/teichoic acid export membrane protein